MASKYSNIFWHQGVKIFEEELLTNEKGRTRISHLENDVTKSLLNVRIEKRYPSNEVHQLKKRVVPFFKNEVLELTKLAESVVK